MKKSSFAAVAALSGALIAPAAALAAPAPTPPPTFTSSYIVPTKSVGGLKLGGPASSAIKIFGKDCTAKASCFYTAPDQSWTISVLFAAKTQAAAPVIAAITLTVSKLSSPSVPDLKTSSGVGIGSSPAALKRAYPKLLGSAKTGYYTSSKVPLTDYSFTNGHLSTISMRSVQLG